MYRVCMEWYIITCTHIHAYTHAYIISDMCVYQEMTSKEAAHITDFKKCDFTKMLEYFKEKSEAKKQLTKEEKQVRL